MKYLLLSLVSFSPLLCCAQSYILYENSIVAGSASISPKRTVKETKDGIVFSYNFNGATISKDTLYPNAYSWYIGGFEPISELGKPEVLVHSDLVDIPSDAIADIQLLESSYVDFSYELSPARPDIYVGETLNADLVKPVADFEGFYPSSVVSEQGIEEFRNQNSLRINVFPIQYNVRSKTIRAYEKISYKVIFKHNGKKLRSNSLKKAQSSISSVDNFLIISTPKYEAPAKKFAAWKECLGYRTHIELRNRWELRSVKDVISSYYKSYSIKYILFLGGEEDIPYNVETYWDNGAAVRRSFISDYSFLCMGGSNDKVADIISGRIPVTSLSDAEAIIDKTIQYEKCPPQNNYFWNTPWLICKEHEDTPGDVETNEAIAQYAISMGKKVEYETKDAWEEFNKGHYYLTIIDHGYKPGMLAMGGLFKSSQLENLRNKELLPVVFSIACKSGMYNKQYCISEAFLRNPNGGGVAVISPTGDAMVTPSNKLLKEVSKYIIGVDRNNEFHLGDLLFRGLRNVNWETRSLFHLFGDPSLIVHTATPTKYGDVYVYNSRGKVEVRIKDGSIGNISLIDTENEDFQSTRASLCYFTLKNQESCSAEICISDYNKIPYIEKVNYGMAGISDESGISNFSYSYYTKSVIIDYVISKNAKSAEIRVVPINGSSCSSFPLSLSPRVSRTTISLSGLSIGMYSVCLVVDGVSVDSKSIYIPN